MHMGMFCIGMLGDHVLRVDHPDPLQVFLRDFDHFFIRNLFARAKAQHRVKNRLVLIWAQDSLMLEILGHRFVVMTPYPLGF
jgi:hypothetical protein